MKAIFGKILGVTILLGFFFGLLSVIFAPLEMYSMKQAESWPSRKGVITLSYNRYIGRFSRGGPFWDEEICGNYVDNGERFCISRVRYGDFRCNADKDYSDAIIAKYPIGREVDVYYNPSKPKVTILENHPSWRKMQVTLGLGIAFLLLPFFLWLFRKQIEPQRYK